MPVSPRSWAPYLLVLGRLHSQVFCKWTDAVLCSDAWLQSAEFCFGGLEFFKDLLGFKWTNDDRCRQKISLYSLQSV
jgi:hypothetical protein